MSKFEKFGSVTFSPTAVTDKEEVHGLYKKQNGGSGVCDWNTMINKPFGEETSYSDTLTWDGQPTDISFEMDGMTFYRISDVILSEEDLSKTINLTSPLGETFPYTFDKVTENLYNCNDVLWYVTVDNYHDTVPKAGIYTSVIDDGLYISELTIPGFNKFPTTQIKTIDERYLPEGTGSGGIALVEVTEGDDGVLTGSATFEEIRQMICNGKQVYVIYGDYVYTLSGGVGPSMIFNGISPMGRQGSALVFTHFRGDGYDSLEAIDSDEWVHYQ